MFDGPLVSLPWVHWPYYCIITPNITRVSSPSGHKLNSNPKGFLAMTSMTVLAEYVQYCTSTSIAVEVEFGQFLWCRSIKYKYCKIQSNSLSWLFLSTHPNKIQLWPTLLFMGILRIVVFIHIHVSPYYSYPANQNSNVCFVLQKLQLVCQKSD